MPDLSALSPLTLALIGVALPAAGFEAIVSMAESVPPVPQFVRPQWAR